LVIYLEYIGTSVADLVEARRLLEPLALRRTIELLDEEGIAALRHELRPGPVSQPGLHRQDRLHQLLGHRSGNTTLHLLVDVLARLTTRYAHMSVRVSAEETARNRRRMADSHLTVVEATVAGDAGPAVAALDEHLVEIGRILSASAPQPGAPRSGIAADLASMGPGVKLAEVVAARLHDEIAAAGWQIGSVHGSEAALLERFGISRSVLREAIRLLESHSVARMRRGPGGGLVVTEPQPWAGVETMALYLDHQGIQPQDLRSVREVLELGCLDRVFARRGEQAVPAAVEGRPTPSGPAQADSFHLDLADAAASPVLGLFLRIVTELWGRHIEARRPEVGPGSHTPVVADAHGRILEALRAGDLPLARHRMQRHLAALSDFWHS
uniref:FCD domain-containing protein n=1 Tax=Pseudonocardia pini TaxID=2758030 RepID=UPI0015F0181D